MICDAKAAAAQAPPDPRYRPLYTLGEVARYARVKPSTLYDWALGRHAPVGTPGKHFPALFQVAAPARPDLCSFINLIEAHILEALRRTHRVSVPRIRNAVAWLAEKTGSGHPLAELDIETDGFNLFVRHLGQLVSASEHGQGVLREVMEGFVCRVERDRAGVPVQFYPFTRAERDSTAPRLIVMNAAVAFGRPVIAGTRITTAAVFERYQAGESVAALAADSAVDVAAIEEAIRCEIGTDDAPETPTDSVA